MTTSRSIDTRGAQHGAGVVQASERLRLLVQRLTSASGRMPIRCPDERVEHLGQRREAWPFRCT